MTIHLETTIPATPEQVYEVLADGAAFGKATGMPGYGGVAEGEFFSVHDGNTVGRQVELVPGERVVQAMRLGAGGLVAADLYARARAGGDAAHPRSGGVPARVARPPGHGLPGVLFHADR
jgi:uncharacterized protein YndB with AHSA1/START domain